MASLATWAFVAEKKEQVNDALDATRAFGYLQEVCRIGRRPSGSPGMTAQQKLLTDHFTNLGAAVQFQAFDIAHPVTGVPVRMNNMIVAWQPQSRRRVLLACHYDTRPFPDRDPRNPQGIFIGANDGASGVALLMELGHHMPGVKLDFGVDFVFFDGEEFIFGPRDKYFLGSEFFATEYKNRPPEHRYAYGIVVDMIGDRSLNLFQEKNSVHYAPELTAHIWKTAQALKVREFIPRVKHEIQDDHLPLNDIARIPSCDIIDFDYPAWHTTADIPAQCSGESLGKVGRVLRHALADLELPAEK